MKMNSFDCEVTDIRKSGHLVLCNLCVRSEFISNVDLPTFIDILKGACQDDGDGEVSISWLEDTDLEVQVHRCEDESRIRLQFMNGASVISEFVVERAILHDDVRALQVLIP
jgi:hypothetical protein